MKATQPSDREIVLTRTFAAPRETVFAALTQPEHIQKWLAAAGMKLITCEVDLRTGGKLRYVFERPSGRTIEVRGVFEAVNAPRRVAYAESYDFSPLEVSVTTTLESTGEQTTFEQRLRYATKEERDADFDGVVESSEQAYANLERYLSENNAPAKRDIVVTRVFDAPVEKAWRAWSEGALVQRWWGPTGFTCPVATMDFREGGTSLVCMRAPKEWGGKDMYNTWTYETIVPLKRIAYVLRFSDEKRNPVEPAKQGLPAEMPKEVRNGVTFKKSGDGKTEVTVTEYDWPVGPLREMSQLGLEQCLDKMAALLAE